MRLCDFFRFGFPHNFWRLWLICVSCIFSSSALLLIPIPTTSYMKLFLQSRKIQLAETHEVQGRIIGGRGRGSVFGVRGHERGHVVIFQENMEESWSTVVIAKSQVTPSNCPLLQGKQQPFRSIHVAIAQEEQSDSRSSINKEQIKEQFYKMFQQFQTSTPSSFTTTLVR